MILAKEAPSRALQALGCRAAAETLRSLGNFTLAREKCERALELEPEDAASRNLKSLLLDSLHRSNGAPKAIPQPSQVFLFSGHMIDKPGRKPPRFPADKEPVAASAIEKTLDELKTSTDSLGLCSGANGGDLLFAEACLRRGMGLELRLPFEEQKFLRESVTFAGGGWRDRFYAVKGHPKTTVYVMPEELGPTPPRMSPFQRVNLWQLYTAIAWGDDRMRFVCLWDGRSGDGPGGTQHMFEVARSRRARVVHLDTTKLFGLAAGPSL